MNVHDFLSDIAARNGIDPSGLQFPDCEINPDNIKVVMISEVPPQNPEEGFYSAAADPDYMRTTSGLFEAAGFPINGINDILNMGIYVTTASKSPKNGYAVDTALIKAHLPILEAELSLFPKLKAIMLMGDVAKKAFNMIVKAKTKKNVIPSESTYKIRHNEYYWDSIRVFPSYIMTGGNILIEKSKREMIADDIRRMMDII
jgi:uracil-DNA glycosylase